MGNFPTAAYTINAVTQITPGIEQYDVEGDVMDGSGTYSPSDFGVGDFIFDSGIYGSFRWKVLEKLVPAVNNGISFRGRVEWSDEGTPILADTGPFGGPGAICKACPGKYGVSTCPSLSANQAYGYSETLYNTIQNSNDRLNDLGLLSFIGGSGGPSDSIKQMQSGHETTISSGKPVSKLPNGKIVPADSDAANGQKYIGITKVSIAVEALGDIYLPGNNIPNAILGLGFTPGDEVFLSETSGMVTNNPSSFTNNDDSIIKIGIADCSAGTASSTATDLIMFSEVIARP